MGAEAYEEDFDDAFMLEVDAAEAAALQQSRKRRGVDVGERHREQRSGTSRLSGPVPKAMSSSTPSPDTAQSASTGACDEQGGLQEYRWTVDSFFIQDDGDGLSTPATEEIIGKVRSVD